MENNQETQILIEILNDCRVKVTVEEPNGKKESFERNYGSKKILERKVDSLKAEMEKTGAEVKVEELVMKNTAPVDASELGNSSELSKADAKDDQADAENQQAQSFDDNEDERFEAGIEEL